VESFSEHAPSAEFIELWLDRTRASDSPNEDLIVAVERLRSAIEPHRSAPPKASGGSARADEPASSIDTALQDFFEHHAAIKQPASLSESDLVRRIISDIRAITPAAVAATIADLTALVLAMVQFTAFHLNQKQSGTRKIPWLGDVPDEHGHYPKEHVLSDALSFWLSATGLRAQIELVNIGGGEADLAVRFTDESFYIEVKRVLSREDDEAATDHYGDQASQYAATDVPIVFLALLDYARRSVRVDLEGAAWTQKHLPDPQSRNYSLTGFRIQGNVASPSTSSRRRRGK
jgi:Holliday junction resolvase-like predicted endonuclease